MVLLFLVFSSSATDVCLFSHGMRFIEEAGSVTFLPLERQTEFSEPNKPYDGPMVALTFDDGPSKRVTDRILDLLEKHSAKATFFVLGSNVEAYPDKLERMLELGCEIGNHSYDHKNLPSISREAVEYQLETTKWCIYEACGSFPTLVRPPYGNVDDKVLEFSELPIILWSLDTMDWKSRNTELIKKIAINKVRDGDIILMHDIYSFTADACETIIPALIKKGYKLVTVSELIEAKGFTVSAGEEFSRGR